MWKLLLSLLALAAVLALARMDWSCRGAPEIRIGTVMKMAGCQ